MSRTQMVLAGILLVQVVLILLVRAPFTQANVASSSVALFPALAEKTPDRLELMGKDDKVSLVKSGDAWSLQDLDGFPADGERVDKLVENLKELQVRRPVVSSDRYHDAFQIGDGENEGRVRGWAGDSDELFDLVVGSAPNYRALHVRRGGEDAVYEVRGLASYDIQAKAGNWASKQLVEVAQSDVVNLKVVNGKGSFEVELQGGEWKIVAPESRRGASIDSTRLDALLRAATSIRIADPVGRNAGNPAESAAATVELRYNTSGQAEGAVPGTEELTIWIGDKPEGADTQRYIYRSGFDFTSTIWESSVRGLLEDGLDELIAESTEEDDDPESSDDSGDDVTAS